MPPTDRFWLIPVANAYPAIGEHFERYPYDPAAPVTDEELRDAIDGASAFVTVSQELIEYAQALGWSRREN